MCYTMSINKEIIEAFLSFTRGNDNENLLGRCYECCGSFLRTFTLQDNDFNVLVISNSALKTQHNHNHVCDIYLVKVVCAFESMQHFEQHSQLLYESLKVMHGATTVSIPCMACRGETYRYHRDGIYLREQQTCYGVGFPHYVIQVVRTNGERYLLDPSISQFACPPSYVVLCD